MKAHSSVRHSAWSSSRDSCRRSLTGHAFGTAMLVLAASLAVALADSTPRRAESDSGAPRFPVGQGFSPLTVVSLPSGTSFQVNVSSTGQNIVGDAANEPSMCIDPNNPNRIAIGWRQFNSTNSDFREAGFAFSTNGGTAWTFGGVLQTNIFRSDPVLASDAEGRFYYLSFSNQASTYQCDIWRSTNSGTTWQLVSQAAGGDKPWMTIDTTSGPGHGNIYQAWDPASITSNRDFSLSYDGGQTWTNPFVIPQSPSDGTLDVGPNGQAYLVAWNGTQFWSNRSTNAPNSAAPFNFDLTVPLNLGGKLLSRTGPNPGGLLGQVWVAVDRSTNSTRGNVYALCSTGGTSNKCDIRFTRSINGGANWSAPVRINTDPGTNAWHWFGTLSVAPNGRVDVCWYDTRSNTNNNFSELYYCYSLDGGLSWSANRPVSPAFDTSLGYPGQNKIGDYISMISLNDAVCIAYTATFNGEEDIYLLRIPDLPIHLAIATTGTNLSLFWNAVVGNTYCVQYKADLTAPWPIGTNQICVVATNAQMTVSDTMPIGVGQLFYRVVTAAYGASVPHIVQQPASLTNFVSLVANFSVIAYGAGPLSYQWQRDGTDIPGATRNTLKLRPLAMGDAGAYLVRITNVNGAITSSPAMLTVLQPPTNAPAISGLVLHLPFDNNLTDVTGRGNDGTAIQLTSTSSNVASPSFVTGIVGSSLHYSSDFGVYPCCTKTNSTYVTLGVRPDLQFSSNVNFSVAYWIRLPLNYRGGDLPFFTDAINSTFGSGFVFAPTYGSLSTSGRFTVDGGWALSLYDPTRANGIAAYGDTGSINDGNWHHLVHTFDRVSGMVTYLDGVTAHYSSQGTTSSASFNVDTGNPATIGQDPTGQYPESGSADIDDLGVWKKALTAFEAASIYMAAASNHLSFTGAGPVLLSTQAPVQK